MYFIKCDKCTVTSEVQWSQMMIGWFQDKRVPKLVGGSVTIVNKGQGEYLEQVGHGSLPLPADWEYHFLTEDTEDMRYTHLCPACRIDV